MTKFRTILIDGLDIFYREAGDPSNPTILLLHGFPTSSHMFRNLMPAHSKTNVGKICATLLNYRL